MTLDAMQRTVCDCDSCVTCCKHMPGSLVPADIKKIVLHQLGSTATDEETGDWLLDHFEASDGSKLGLVAPGQAPRIVQIPSIVPRLTSSGCVFLRDGRCQIHAVSPAGCAYFDMHMSAEAGQAVATAVVKAQLADWQEQGVYAKLWFFLRDRGRIATPLLQRRQRLDQALSDLEPSNV